MEKPLTDHPSDIPTVEKPDFDCPESDRGRWINRLLPGGIRERLFLLITLALTPLLVLVGWIFYQRYHIRHAQALQTEVEVARGIATTFAAYIEGVQERNLAIGQAFITNPSYSAADASHFLTHTAALLPIVRSVSWISPQGIVTASSLPEAVGLDLSGRGYFQAVLAGQDWMLDDLLLSSATPDTPIVAVANGIRDEQGTLHGVMLTTLHPARLGALVFTQPRPASGAYAIFDRRGVLAYSSQDGDLTWEERRARQANDQLLQQVLATGEEQVDIVELEVPGGRWVTAQVPIAGLGWVAGARRPVAVAIDPVERALVLDGLLALFVGLLGFGTAAFLGQTISRPLHRLEEDAERMGTGVLESQPDPMAPTEVRHLRCTVENMASALLLRAEALQRSRMLLAGAEQLSHTGAWEWDLTTNQWMFSDEWLAIHGCQKSTLTPDELLQISHPDDRQEARQAFEAVRAGLRPYDLEHRILRQDTGEVRMVRVHGQFEKNPAGEIVRVYGFAQDVTERKRAEDEALEALAHLEVQRRLTEQREKERMQIARDLHDGPLQNLSLLSFELSTAAQMARDKRLEAAIQAAIDSVRAQIQELREFTTELRPPLLMKFGLARAITAHADSFQGKHPDLRLHLEIEQDNAALPEANRLTLYRIYQEALNNILKHAQASEVWIRLRMEAHGAALEIQDNGEGFILPGQWLDLARQGHLGLVGMQERAEAVGGAFQVHSRPGFGTTLYVSVPVTITLAP